MSDFPRGWTFTNGSGGGAASITVAAVAGVVHVLDGFFAQLVSGDTSVDGFDVRLSSSDGVFTNLVLAHLVTNANAAVTDANVATDSASGLDLAAGPGASLTIAFSGFTGNTNEFLRIQGHDI